MSAGAYNHAHFYNGRLNSRGRRANSKILRGLRPISGPAWNVCCARGADHQPARHRSRRAIRSGEGPELGPESGVSGLAWEIALTITPVVFALLAMTLYHWAKR
jgi:hypothetical protein